MPNISKSTVESTENVARAIFLPAMVDLSGKVSRAAFYLRHNESYFSVARMSVNGWQEDIFAIPQNESRRLVGFARMNVGEIRNLELSFYDCHISFDVVDKSTEKNNSHSGITVALNDVHLSGDKAKILKPIPENMPASMLLLKIQSCLAKLANKGLTRFTNE